MKYCTGCGAKIEDDAKFCTVCGTPVGAAGAESAYTADYSGDSYGTAVKAKKKFPLWAIIALAVVVLAGGAYAAIAGGLFTSAPAQFVDMAEELTDPVTEAVAKVVTGDESLTQDNKLELNTDIIVSGSFPSTGDTTLDELLEGASLTFQVNAQEDEDALLGLKLNLDGSDVLTGFFKFSEDGISLSLPELDDGYYSIALDDLPEILEAFGIYSDEIEFAADNAGNIGKSLVDLDTEEVEKVLQKYFDIFYSIVNKDNTTKENGTVEYDVLEGEVKCGIITFEPGEDDIEKAAEALVETLQDDDDLRDIIEAVAERISADQADYIMDQYDKGLDQLDENMDQWVQELCDMELVFTIGCKGERVYSFKVLDRDGNGIGYESCGNSLSERSDALISYTDEDARAMAVNSYEVNGTKVEGELECDAEFVGTETSVEYELSIKDKSGLNIPYGDYTIRMGENKYTLTVEEDKDGSMHEVSFRVNGEKVELDILSTDKKSTVKEPDEKEKSITADNIQDILSDMANQAFEIFANLYA